MEEKKEIENNNNKIEDKEENYNNYKIIEQKATEFKAIPSDLLISNQRAICRLIIDIKDKKGKKDKEPTRGTGFFIKIKNEKEYYFLISNEHVINKSLINTDEKIELILNLDNDEKDENYFITLNEKERKIICLHNEKQDISAVEILDTDKFKSKVKFLSVDLNYIDGYSQYIGQNVFMLEHPEGKIIHICAGRITNFLKNNNEKQNFDDNQNYYFEHILSTEPGSSGSPIILLYNERVIGIHRGSLGKGKYNCGSFIGEIVNAINKKIDKEKKLSEKKELKNSKKNKNNEKKEDNNTESEKNMFKYELNGEEKYAKLSDTIIVKANDVITFNYQDFQN